LTTDCAITYGARAATKKAERRYQVARRGAGVAAALRVRGSVPLCA